MLFRSNGCSFSKATTLSNVGGPSISSAVVTNVLCSGGSNGSIDITLSGGSIPFTYQWSNGQVTQDVSTLQAGNYTVTVTDANNCIVSSAYTINQPSAISIAFSSSATTCNQSNGILAVAVAGGNPPYVYQWNTGSVNDSLINVAAASYSVTVTDANGCTKVGSSSVSANIPPTVVLASQTNVLCNGDSTGSLLISVNGGALPFTFVWSNGSTSQNVSNLKVGTYKVTVTDANGCTNTKTFTITQPAFLSLANYTVTNATCSLANGSVLLSPSGGVPPYTYLWSNGATTNPIVNIAAGNYSVTVTDANGCARRRNASVSNTNGPVLT